MSAVAKLFHPFLALIASASEHELAKYLEYLKEENKLLRARLPEKQIHTTPAERERLLKFGKPLGRAIEELITIVKPASFYRWCRDGVGRQKPMNPKGGRRKPREIRELVITIAKTLGFGYTRIIGELRKLGIKRISRQTVRNILLIARHSAADLRELPEEVVSLKMEQIEVRSYVGELIKSFERKAA